MRQQRLAAALKDIPELMMMTAGTPNSRKPPPGEMEQLWVPGGLILDSKYAIVAAIVWPLRFADQDVPHRIREFMEVRNSPLNTPNPKP